MNDARKPERLYRLLTLRQAEQELGLDYRAIYLAAAAGRVHPVKPAGRTLYPEWELRALVGRDRDAEQASEGAPYGAVFEGTAAA